MPFSIFLVHGTFARNAPWIQEQSALRVSLENNLNGTDSVPTDSVPKDFVPVDWSGANTTKARQAGVDNLTAKLRKSFKENPSHEHIVIGHSHGGTIAFQAVNTPEFIEKVRVVLLSTPILTPRKRQISGRVGFALGASAYLSAMIMLGAAGIFLDLPANFGVLSSMVIAGIAVFVLRRHLRRSTDFILRHNSITALDGIRMLIVRESADEASSFLGAVQLATRLVTMGFSVIEAAADAVDTWTRKAAEAPLAFKTLAANTVLLLMSAAVLSTVLYTFNDAFHLKASAVMIGVVLAILTIILCFRRRSAVGFARYGCSVIFVLVAMIVCIPAFPLWLLLALFAFPIRESILSAAFVDVSAEPTPEGEWSLTHFVPTKEALLGSRLAHSAAYNDPRVFALIADWIKSNAPARHCVPQDRIAR
jgi:pimeloyl-ACP methyl ester carboxylesterase